MSRLPAIFVGHGSPYNIFTENSFTKSLKSYGENFFQKFQPNAIVIISAHWLTQGTFLTANKDPKMIYDYYGFPKSFYEYTYPAKGSPEIVERILKFLPSKIKSSLDWGIDHAATIVLENILPSGEIPIIELSLNFQQKPKYHLELGKQLAPLRDQGIFFIGSGNLIHTFREIDFDISSQTYPWAKELDAIQKKAIDNKNFDDLLDINKMSFNLRGFQSLDHYLPMLYIIGMLQKEEEINFIFEGFQHASISHRTFEIK